MSEPQQAPATNTDPEELQGTNSAMSIGSLVKKDEACEHYSRKCALLVGTYHCVTPLPVQPPHTHSQTHTHIGSLDFGLLFLTFYVIFTNSRNLLLIK